MNRETLAPAPGDLSRAFDDFSRHSVAVEAAYRDLTGKVQKLDADLHRANRRLSAELDRSRRTRETLKDLLANLSCGVVMLTADGEVRFANRVARRLLRRVRAHHPAATRRRGHLPGALGAAVARLAAVAAAGNHGRRESVSLAGPRGREQQIEVLVSRTGNDLLVLIDDVSAQLQLARIQARAGRLEAMGRMATEVAHEVRNPLGSVELFAGLLADEVADEPARLEMVQMIQVGTRSIAAVVGNMLSFARSFPASCRQTGLGAVAVEAVRLVAAPARARRVDVAVSTRPAPDIRADPELLQQVILNLVQNAIDASEPGGRVRVRVFAPHGVVALSVTDTGCGMRPDEMEKIFDPFYTGRSDGTGLGLAVVHRLVEHHGGQISVRSRPGRGSRFLLTFPPATAPCEEDA
ncbi:MAG: ATP-binding protein [Acidobacteriota bacterium]